jgi:hypothetical protein
MAPAPRDGQARDWIGHCCSSVHQMRVFVGTSVGRRNGAVTPGSAQDSAVASIGARKTPTAASARAARNEPAVSSVVDATLMQRC